MGLRIEFILSAAIVAIVGISIVLKLNSTTEKAQSSTKELEFTDTVFTEVDTLRLQGRAHGSYGVRDSGILTINSFSYTSDDVKSLTADKARYMTETIYLEGSVVLKQEEGYEYKTEEAEYNKKSALLNITAAFIATKEKNILRGDTLWYDTRKKEANGTMIRAVLYTIDK